jgi:hypothetical protein
MEIAMSRNNSSCKQTDRQVEESGISLPEEKCEHYFYYKSSLYLILKTEIPSAGKSTLNK